MKLGMEMVELLEMEMVELLDTETVKLLEMLIVELLERGQYLQKLGSQLTEELDDMSDVN